MFDLAIVLFVCLLFALLIGSILTFPIFILELFQAYNHIKKCSLGLNIHSFMSHISYDSEYRKKGMDEIFRS